MQTFRLVPVQAQEKFWNIVRNDNDAHYGFYDGENKSFRGLSEVTITEMEELMEQVKKL